MRPVNEILTDSYWTVGYRIIGKDTCLDGNKAPFSLIPTSKRYWYADPFLFTHKNDIYLFVETFDNKTEKGFISVSRFDGKSFSEPEKVLEEKHHLSYPYVFEKDGEIYMMPETHEAGCIQLYKSTDFPYKWQKHKVIVNNINAVDTVINDGWLITSELDKTNDMGISLNLYDFETGAPHVENQPDQHSFTKRGAGRVFLWSGKKFRPSQSCENGTYGNYISFWEIKECNKDRYLETEEFRLMPDDIKLNGSKKARRIHTYGIENSIEVVDLNFSRINLRRMWWILSKKL